MMPKIDGFEMVRRIRKTEVITPVLFLTARSSINDVVKGFELGANDYLKKPFGIQELIVRIKALVKRTSMYQTINHSIDLNKEITIGQYLLNTKTEKLIYDSTSQELSHRETEILRMLAENKDTVVETKDILLQLWGDDSFFNTRSLQVFITKLRHKLSKDDNIRIINVRGVGYKLIF